MRTYESGINYSERKAQREKALEAAKLKPVTKKAIKLPPGATGDYVRLEKARINKEILELHLKGQKQLEIAKALKVSKTRVSQIIRKYKQDKK